MLIQCCVCKKIETESDWEPADGIIYDASHTYCPACAKSARAEIQAYKRARGPQSPRRSGRPAIRDLFEPRFYSDTHSGSVR